MNQSPWTAVIRTTQGRIIATVTGAYAFMPPIGGRLTMGSVTTVVKDVEVAIGMQTEGGIVDVTVELP